MITPEKKIKLFKTNMHPRKASQTSPNIFMCPNMFRGGQPIKQSQYYSFGLLLLKMAQIDFPFKKRAEMGIDGEINNFMDFICEKLNKKLGFVGPQAVFVQNFFKKFPISDLKPLNSFEVYLENTVAEVRAKVDAAKAGHKI